MLGEAWERRAWQERCRSKLGGDATKSNEGVGTRVLSRAKTVQNPLYKLGIYWDGEGILSWGNTPLPLSSLRLLLPHPVSCVKEHPLGQCGPAVPAVSPLLQPPHCWDSVSIRKGLEAVKALLRFYWTESVNSAFITTSKLSTVQTTMKKINSTPAKTSTNVSPRQQCPCWSHKQTPKEGTGTLRTLLLSQPNTTC